MGNNLLNSTSSDDNGYPFLVSIFAFFKDLISYLVFRQTQFYRILSATFKTIFQYLKSMKVFSIRNMYWGRGSLYRSFFHIVIISLTIISLFIGISQRINTNKDSSNGLVLATGVIGNNDTIYQAGTVETIAITQNPGELWKVYKHKVKEGETLKSIAENYNVSQQTITWANNLTTENLIVDQVLTVPELSGVLFEVKEGDTLESVIDSVDNANDFYIKELNNLKAPDFILTPGKKIFIPNGVIKIRPQNPYGGYKYVDFNDPGIEVEPGTFVNPLSFCPGYYISQWVTYSHTGIDMAKNDGCWINATADGTITVAGAGTYGEGNYVVIDHGNGFVSSYYHGLPLFAVQKGDKVKAGQRILHMGSTGNSSGTHLHFEMRYNGAVVNPASYMQL